MATDTRESPKTASARRPRTGPAVTLTGRGGVVVVFAATLLGAIVGSGLGLHGAQGFLFVVGCLLAVLTTRRGDLLTLVVSPPLIYFLVSLLTAVLGAFGERSFLLSVLLSVVTTLTSSVPWLFLGAVLVVVIAVPRGLPANLRELSVSLASDNPFRGRTTLRGRKEKPVEDDPVRWDESPG